MAMHLRCQKRMLEAQQDLASGGLVARCGVCRSAYTNVSTTVHWRISWLGALWVTCCIGVAVMLWSGDTVLDKGSSHDPSIHYFSRSWWAFELTHLTWWRLVGLLYVAIAVAMAIAALVWLIWDLRTLGNDSEENQERLFVQRITFNVQNPGDSSLRLTREADSHSARMLL